MYFFRSRIQMQICEDVKDLLSVDKKPKGY